MLSGKGYQACDTEPWALGVVLYAMLIGKLPFDCEDNEALIKERIKECDFDFLCKPQPKRHQFNVYSLRTSKNMVKLLNSL